MCLPRKFKWLCDIPSDTTRKGCITSMNHNLHKRRVGKESNLRDKCGILDNFTPILQKRNIGMKICYSH